MPRTSAYCRYCKAMTDTDVHYERAEGMVIRDTWTCKDCGHVGHSWVYDPSTFVPFDYSRQTKVGKGTDDPRQGRLF